MLLMIKSYFVLEKLCIMLITENKMQSPSTILATSNGVHKYDGGGGETRKNIPYCAGEKSCVKTAKRTDKNVS